MIMTEVDSRLPEPGERVLGARGEGIVMGSGVLRGSPVVYVAWIRRKRGYEAVRWMETVLPYQLVPGAEWS